MKTKALLLISVFLIILGLAWISSGVQAAPGELQVAYPSPTPGPDGRIIYIVKAGDNCERISLMYGVSLDSLRTTNQLDANCSLREGQELMLGVGGPSAASPTPGPSPIPTAAPPTATPSAGGIAEVCVLIYDDANGDGLRQTTERAIPGAAISLTSLDGAYSQTLTTTINPDATAYQGMCFTNVPMGKYNVSAAPPDGYNPTINLTSSMDVTAGDIAYIDFGAQSGTVAEANIPRNKPSPLLGIVGAVFLLAGIGMGVYVWSLLRKK
ncbi:MAG: LysM peptidoglycan-binding domain-containing protein [Candidatus Atribacteria bacterium]|nr:LysM peptidoglycan-binding domain-containing protein [Candidatus Atribacteria bacterium]